MVRKVLLGLSLFGFLGFGGIAKAQVDYGGINGILTERMSGYVRGVEDTLNFLQAELNVQPPKGRYWLWIDVSSLPFWKRVAFANVLKEKNGRYPAYLYNAVTYQTLFVVDSSDNPDRLLEEAKRYKNLYPTLKVSVAKVTDPKVFRPVVQLGVCKLPKPRVSYEGINEALQTAINLAEQLGDEELTNYLKKVFEKVKKYEELKQEG